METIEKRVKKIIGKQLSLKERQINNSDTFIKDLGADSLDIIELFMALEEEFQKEIPDEDVEKIKSVQTAIDYISKNSKKNSLKIKGNI
ncbi:MAG: acyl carrier protein [Candidatus Dasytiphilus stammeri]